MAKAKGNQTDYCFTPIGVLQSCYKEKFGIPRQSGMVADSEAILKLNSDPFLRTAIKELETFSHLWLVFVFHEHDAKAWKPSIRPPRLGGARKVGVLASRSPHRPNPIGLSAVKLEKVDIDAIGGPELHLRGVDILDGTPILDIKPYIPYADSIPDANPGWAGEPIQVTPVEFTALAASATEERAARGGYTNLKQLIVQMLGLDPRPAFQKRRAPPDSPQAQGTRYGFRVFDYDVKYEIRDGKFLVLNVIDFVTIESGAHD